MKTPLAVVGKVVHGDKTGRTLGFPTANLDTQLSPRVLKPGVYFGRCRLGEKVFPCLPYFGPRLVFGETKYTFEVFIFNFSDDIYDQVLTVYPDHFIREPLPFTSLTALKHQLELDRKEGLTLIKEQNLELAA